MLTIINNTPDILYIPLFQVFLDIYFNNIILLKALRLKFKTLFMRIFHKNKLFTCNLELLNILHSIKSFEDKDIQDSLIYKFININFNNILINESDDLTIVDDIIKIIKQIPFINSQDLIKKYQINSQGLIKKNEVIKKEVIELIAIDKNQVKIEPKAFMSKSGSISIDIFRGKYKDNSVVIKRYSENKINEHESSYIKEAQFLQLLSEKKSYFLKFYGFFKSVDSYSIVMENCTKSLENELLTRKKEGIYIAFNEFINIAYQLLEAFYYLEQLNICHRDIKPKNIFLKENSIKIGDFSISEY